MIPVLYPISYIKRQFNLLFNAHCINIIFNTGMLMFGKLDGIFRNAGHNVPLFLPIQLNNCDRIHFNSLFWVSDKMHCISVSVKLRLKKSRFLYDRVIPKHISAGIDCVLQPADFPRMLTMLFTRCFCK